MSTLIIFIQKAIAQGIGMLFGATGEIITEKSGNLNLGVPGLMYMGGIAGLMGAFVYENGTENPIGIVGVIISMLCALIASGLGALIYSVLTITLRANQNVTGLALTTFGVGFGNFFGGSLSQLAGGVGQISVAVTGATYKTKIPGLSKIPVIGDILFSYGFMTYFGIILAILVSWFMFKTRKGLNLRAIGESPAIISLRCPVYPLPLYTGTWSFHAGNLQDAAVSCNHHCADFYKLPKEERISASGESWQLLLPRRSINEKSFTIPEYANKLRNRLNRWRVSITNMLIIETRHLFCRLSFFTEADNNF